jgi:hypothetical protein
MKRILAGVLVLLVLCAGFALADDRDPGRKCAGEASGVAVAKVAQR